MPHPCHLLPEVAGSRDVINQWIGTVMIALHKENVAIILDMMNMYHQPTACCLTGSVAMYR